MFEINLDSIKQKVSQVVESTVEIAKEIGSEATQIAKEIGDDVAQKAKEIGSGATQIAKEIGGDVAQKAKEIGSEATQIAKEIGDGVAQKAKDAALQIAYTVTNSDIPDAAVRNVTEIYDNIKTLMEKNETHMEHRILMMGGRRAGKSTILSSILSQLREKTPGTICTIIDKTDYTQQIETNAGSKPLPTLDIKQNEVKRYLSKRQLNTEFLVDMNPTYGKASYILEVSANNTTIDLEFIDVPGEWMRANVAEHAQLQSFVESSDVFVIVIDTPFLMNTDDDEGASVNLVYNRINEITQAMSRMKVDSPNDLKQIILCPVKCEKWLHQGKADLVVSKVLKSYRDLINRWVTTPEVTIQIMPIETIGGLESSRMLPAKLFFKDDDDLTGASCSIDPLTNTITNKDGHIMRQTANSRVEDDPFWSIDYIDIPLSWYSLNGAGLKPRFCEQPGFHILKFLVEKEEKAIKSRADYEKEKLYQKHPFWRWLTKVFNPTFGVYFPIWKNVISKLSTDNYIKTEDDGFCYVRSKIA